MNWKEAAIGTALVGLCSTAIYLLIEREEPVPTPVKSEESDESREILSGVSEERARIADENYERWRKENIVTMADKMWDYQMESYDRWESGLNPGGRYRWTSALYPPSLM